MEAISLTGATLLPTQQDGVADPLANPSPDGGTLSGGGDKNMEMVSLLSSKKNEGQQQQQQIKKVQIYQNPNIKHHKHHHHGHSMAAMKQANEMAQAMSLLVPMDEVIHKSDKEIKQMLWTLVRLGRFEPFKQLWELLERKRKEEKQQHQQQQEGGTKESTSSTSCVPFLTEMDDNGHLLLHWAAKRVDEIQFIKFLLHKITILDIPMESNNNTKNLAFELLNTPSQDSSGMTPVHWACTESELSIRLLSVMFQYVSLTQNQTKPGTQSYEKQLMEVRDKSGCTPLLIAAQHGQTEVVAYLLEKGANIHAMDHMNDTAVHWAAYKGSIQVLGLLLYYHCSNQNNQSDNATSHHSYNQHVDDSETISSVLMLCDTYGQTPLHLASLRGHTSVVRYLLYQVGGSTTYNSSTTSPTFLPQNKHKIREWLSTKDRNQRTPYDLAVHKNRPTVANLLRLASIESVTKSKSFFNKQQLLDQIKQFFSLYNWKLWMGMNPGTFPMDEIDEAPKFPFYYLWFHMLLHLFFIYPFIFCPIYNISGGFLWDYSSFHFWNVAIGISSMVFLYLTTTTDPGRLVEQDTKQHSNKNKSSNQKQMVQVQPWKNLYRETLKSYVQNAEEFGNLPQHKIPLCHTCHIARPLRSKHCRVSRCCVLMFDHHCPFVDNTVGMYNHKWFYLFLLCMALYMLGYWYFYVLYVFRYRSSHAMSVHTVTDTNIHLGTNHGNGAFAAHDINSQSFPWVFMLFGGFCGLHAMPIFGLFIYHTQLMLTNLTTNEHINVHRYDYLFIKDENSNKTDCKKKVDACGSGNCKHRHASNNKRRYKNPWFKGMYQNLLMRFNPQESLYLYPSNDRYNQFQPYSYYNPAAVAAAAKQQQNTMDIPSSISASNHESKAFYSVDI